MAAVPPFHKRDPDTMTRIVLSSDHAAIDLRQAVAKHVQAKGYEVHDIGPTTPESERWTAGAAVAAAASAASAAHTSSSSSLTGRLSRPASPHTSASASGGAEYTTPLFSLTTRAREHTAGSLRRSFATKRSPMHCCAAAHCSWHRPKAQFVLLLSSPGPRRASQS